MYIPAQRQKALEIQLVFLLLAKPESELFRTGQRSGPLCERTTHLTFEIEHITETVSGIFQHFAFGFVSKHTRVA